MNQSHSRRLLALAIITGAASLVAGCRGWLAWNNCDYDDLHDEDPYRHHVFEMHFGLTDRRGRPKPQLQVLGEFALFVRELAETGWERVAGEAATDAR